MRNGSGTYARAVSAYVYGTIISQTDVNAEMDDIATALTASLAKDGQTVPTANLPMGGYKLTGLGSATVGTDALALGQMTASGGSALVGFLQSGTGATARTVQSKLLELISVKDFGVVGDGVTDDSAAINAAIAAVSAAGGGVLNAGAKTYKCLSRIDLLDGVRLVGVQGLTKFDFSDKADWENGNTSGLIRAQGALGSSTALSASVKVSELIVPLLVTATRAGTTVSAETNVAHNLATGELVWISYSSFTAGQAVFYNVTQGTESPAKLVPFAVTVTGATTFTYEVPDTGDAALTGTAYLYRCSDVIEMADTSTYAVGDSLLITSDDGQESSGQVVKLGEWQKVARIISSTMIQIHGEVQNNYLSASNAKLYKPTLLHSVGIDGIEVIGRGPNTATTDNHYGDRGIVMWLCDEPRVEHCKITNVDQMGIYIWSSLGGSIKNNSITFNGSDEAGSVSGATDIQYGIAYGGALYGLEISGNNITGGRHQIIESNSSAEFGIARYVTISSNTCIGAWLVAISAHAGTDHQVVSGNIITGAQSGVNYRWCKNLIIANNEIQAYDQGIYLYNYIENVTISGNNVRCGTYGFQVASTLLNTASFPGPLVVDGNTFIGGTSGIYIYPTLQDVACNSIDIINNTVMTCSRTGIVCHVGTDAGGSWQGAINNNRVIDVGRGGSSYGIWAFGMAAGSINDNTFRGAGTALAYGIYMSGTQMGSGLHIWDNAFLSSYAPTPIYAAQGTWHRTNAPLANQTYTIASGVISPKYATPMIYVGTESAAATDDLDTITGGFPGQQLIIRAENDARDIVVRDGTGNIQTVGSASQTLDGNRDTITLVYTGSEWLQLAVSQN